MISDEEWKKGPDWSKWTPRTILKKNSAAVKKAEQLEVAAYREYKAAGGPLKWSAWRHFYKTKKENQCGV